MNELEQWFHDLPTDEKLLLVRKLLDGIETDLDEARSAKEQGQEPPAAMAASLPPAKPAVLDDSLPPPGDLDHLARTFAGQTSSPQADIDLLRLEDAAERFHKLLVRYGYVKAPPTLVELARKAREADERLAFHQRKRPHWHSWVSKEDEEHQAREAAELDAIASDLVGLGTLHETPGNPGKKSPAEES